MKLIPHPVGNRLKVKILPHEIKSEKGLFLPTATFSQAMKQPSPEEKEMAMTTLQFAVILEVGEGRFNPMDGSYRGSRYKEGQKVYLRVGPSAQIHIDFLPGKSDECLVLEDLVAATVEETGIEFTSVERVA